MVHCKTISLVGLMLVVGLCSLSAARAADCDVPSPTQAVAPPAPSVPASAAAFSGTWGGSWLYRGMRKTMVSQCARLYVSVVSANSANVSYCYGSRSDTGFGKQCDRYTATISGNTLAFTSNLSSHFTFTNQGNALAGEAHSDAGQGSTQTSFQKM